MRVLIESKHFGSVKPLAIFLIVFPATFPSTLPRPFYDHEENGPNLFFCTAWRLRTQSFYQFFFSTIQVMFSEVVILYLKRFCSIKNTISYYWWEFSTCRFSMASFLLVTKQPSTGHRSIARPGLDDGPALLSDIQAGAGTTAIAAGSSSRIVELGSSIVHLF